MMPMASVAVCSEAVVMLFIHCLNSVAPIVLWRLCVWSLFCYALLGFLSSFAIISLRERAVILFLVVLCVSSSWSCGLVFSV